MKWGSGGSKPCGRAPVCVATCGCRPAAPHCCASHVAFNRVLGFLARHVRPAAGATHPRPRSRPRAGSSAPPLLPVKAFGAPPLPQLGSPFPQASAAAVAPGDGPGSPMLAPLRLACAASAAAPVPRPGARAPSPAASCTSPQAGRRPAQSPALPQSASCPADAGRARGPCAAPKRARSCSLAPSNGSAFSAAAPAPAAAAAGSPSRSPGRGRAARAARAAPACSRVGSPSRCSRGHLAAECGVSAWPCGEAGQLGGVCLSDRFADGAAGLGALSLAAQRSGCAVLRPAKLRRLLPVATQLLLLPALRQPGAPGGATEA